MNLRRLDHNALMGRRTRQYTDAWNDAKCKTIHTEQSRDLSFSQSSRHFTASQYFLPIKRTNSAFRTMNTDIPASSLDQVKIATLLFVTPFYTEPAMCPPLPNGNKLTTPDFVRQFYPAK
jgi:hypothetical protein